MKKYTTKEFDEFLNAFNEGGSEILRHMAVRLVTSNALWSEICSEISNIRKQSLVRKVLRFVAQTALKGTFEVDGLAQSCNFCQMEYGNPVSFGKPCEFTFTSDVTKDLVRVIVTFNTHMVRCYNRFGVKLLEFKVWNGLHFTTDTGRFDIVQYFEENVKRELDY